MVKLMPVSKESQRSCSKQGNCADLEGINGSTVVKGAIIDRLHLSVVTITASEVLVIGQSARDAL